MDKFIAMCVEGLLIPATPISVLLGFMIARAFKRLPVRYHFRSAIGGIAGLAAIPVCLLTSVFFFVMSQRHLENVYPKEFPMWAYVFSFGVGCFIQVIVAVGIWLILLGHLVKPVGDES